ncbi:hypothetical protein ES708_18039 [subsurface metagenome]
MDFTPSLDAKGFFRFTGPPEHWLTAVKYMTWGLEEKHKKPWAKIQPGDIFFIHSTGHTSSHFSNARPCIIGLGIVGASFTKKDNYLWLEEFNQNKNIWPLLVPLSEIYLFSKLPPVESWESPHPQNIEQTKPLITALLSNSIPLSNIPSFPHMGSVSLVRKEVAQQILYDQKPLYVYTSNEVSDDIYTAKPTKLEVVKDVSETLRYAETLKPFENIKKRVINAEKITYTKDTESLAKADEVHSTILQRLIEIFRSKGYDTRSNRFVDLFAFNDDKSFLFEVKSTESKNFRSQARKGLIQLFEYNYFEVRKFVAESRLNFKEQYKILVPSKYPKDDKYIGFINDLKTGVALAEDKSLKPVGIDLGFSRI